MEAGPSSLPQGIQQEEPTETTALLSSSSASLPRAAHPAAATATGLNDGGEGEQQHGQQDATISDAETNAAAAAGSEPASTLKMRRSIRLLSGTSLALAVILSGLTLTFMLLVTLGNTNRLQFMYWYLLKEELKVAMAYVAIAFATNIWDLRRGGSTGQPQTGRAVLVIVVDALTAAYVLGSASDIAAWAPDQVSCYSWFGDSYPLKACWERAHTINDVLTAWAVLGHIFAFVHFVLFVLRVLLLVRTNRTTRFVTYEGSLNAFGETLASLSVTFGPLAFDFRFSLRRSGADVPAGMVREDQQAAAVAASPAVVAVTRAEAGRAGEV
ncbi:hypothetical protein MN608_10548 [Microdochium nivale]|nr:hypothetical protein MN608_10548 [Microdochium nivale]